MDKVIRFRISEGDRDVFQLAAGRDRRSLSEWARLRLLECARSELGGEVLSPAPSRAEQIVEAAVPLAKDKLAPKSGAWIEGCELPDGVEPLEALRETPGVKPSPRTTPDPDKLAKFSLPSRKK